MIPIVGAGQAGSTLTMQNGQFSCLSRPIHSSMKERIETELEKIEKSFDVKVIYACESGSRAWGFPSANSDYDVRFLYLHPQDWYLAINLEQKREGIELPIENDLDIDGWDFRKALKLFYKSNPPLLEWLGSPIVYLEPYSTAHKMRELAATYYNPLANMYHYLRMAQGNYREYLKGERVWIKKYFYVLRPILAVNWLERGYGVVPTEFGTLVEEIVEDSELKQQINKLVKNKQTGQELDYGARIPIISDFISNELARLENKQFEKSLEKQPVEPLNELFRSALQEVWGGNNG